MPWVNVALEKMLASCLFDIFATTLPSIGQPLIKLDWTRPHTDCKNMLETVFFFCGEFPCDSYMTSSSNPMLDIIHDNADCLIVPNPPV